MGRLVVSAGNGISVQYGGKRIVLDPSTPPAADAVFVSHAHVDHMHKPSGKTLLLASKETEYLARQRRFDLGRASHEQEGFQLIDSGHILGSKGLLIDDEVFYTGDFSLRPRAFLDRGMTVKCRTLIVETTYGRGGYHFPAVSEVVEKTNRLISDLFARGIPVALMGYPLGKAQILSHLFSGWSPIYVHKDVQRMNEAYQKLGVDVGSGFRPYDEAPETELRKGRPWILISPVFGGRSNFCRTLKEKFGAVTVSFTGWAADPSYRQAIGVDHALPLSDHCDFSDLRDLVRACDPEKVYTVHGFATEFAAYLKKVGYDAAPLLGVQQPLTNFVGGD